MPPLVAPADFSEKLIFGLFWLRGVTTKLVALASVSEEANWLRDLLFQIPYFDKPVPLILIHCDSNTAIGKVQMLFQR